MLIDAAATLVGRLTAFLLNASAVVVTARLLGVDGRGVYALVTNYANALSLVGNLGVGTGNTYLISARRFSASEATWGSGFAAIVSGLICCVGGLLLAALVPAPFEAAGRSSLLVGLLSIPGILGLQYLLSVFLGLRLVAPYNAFLVLQAVLLIVLTIFALSRGSGTHGAVAAYSASFAVAAVLALGYLHRIEVVKRPSRRSLSALLEAVWFGWKLQLGNVLQFVNYRIGLYLLSAIAGIHSAGLYSVAVFLAESIWHVSNSFAVVILPRVGSSRSAQEAGGEVSDAARASFVGTVGAAAVLAFSLPLLVPFVFGPAFSSSIPVVYVLLPGAVAFSLTNVLASFFTGRGRAELNTAVAAGSLLVNLALSLLLIPVHGALGSALAGSVAYAISSLLTVWLFLRLSGQTLASLFPTTAEWKQVFRRPG